MASGQTRTVQAGRREPRSEYEWAPRGAPQVVNTCTGTKGLCGSHVLPVPDTDTGGLIEEIKADERTLVKELGKLIPYLWKKGCSPRCTPSRWKPSASRSDKAQATGYQNLSSLLKAQADV